MTPDVEAQLRQLADEAVGPIETGYLRPWMCTGDATRAQVFIVGANAATPLAANAVPRNEYIDALMTGGKRLRDIYLQARMTGRPSPTRLNIDRLTSLLMEHGTNSVLETNVWTMPTASLRELKRSQRDAHAAVLPRLVAILQPKALVVHGVTATQGLGDSLGRHLLPATATPVSYLGSPAIWATPSLSPPAANRWLPAGWAQLDAVARAVGCL
jgi:hypothetical protein